jgi:hypothetical protein
MDTFIAGVEREILTPIVTLLGLAAFVLFVWGVVDFIRSAEDAEKRATGQRNIIFGLLGLVIIFGANAIIRIISASLGVQ